MLKKTFPLPVLASAAALILAGCAATPAGAGASVDASGDLKIIATTTQVAGRWVGFPEPEAYLCGNFHKSIYSPIDRWGASR